MAQMNMIQALNSAMDIMLARDPYVVVLGEDVGYFGGVFRVTDGLQRKYGEHRVLDTPIAEGGIVGAAIGMGVNGLRPIAEIQFADYIYPAFDQIVSELARLRFRSAGDFWAPVTIRTPCGGGIRGGQTHSQSPEAIRQPSARTEPWPSPSPSAGGRSSPSSPRNEVGHPGHPARGAHVHRRPGRDHRAGDEEGGGSPARARGEEGGQAATARPARRWMRWPAIQKALRRGRRE